MNCRCIDAFGKESCANVFLRLWQRLDVPFLKKKCFSKTSRLCKEQNNFLFLHIFFGTKVHNFMFRYFFEKKKLHCYHDGEIGKCIPKTQKQGQILKHHIFLLLCRNILILKLIFNDDNRIFSQPEHSTT